MKLTLKPVNPYESKNGSKLDGKFQQVGIIIEPNTWWVGVTHIDSFWNSGEGRNEGSIYDRLFKGQVVVVEIVESKDAAIAAATE